MTDRGPSKFRGRGVSWVVMGPEPHFAHCERCGRPIEKPTLPAPIQMVVAWMEAGVKLHRKCKVPPASEGAQHG